MVTRDTTVGPLLSDAGTGTGGQASGEGTLFIDGFNVTSSWAHELRWIVLERV